MPALIKQRTSKMEIDHLLLLLVWIIFLGRRAPAAMLRRRCIMILTIWHQCADQTQAQLVHVASQLRSLTFRAVMYAAC